MSDTPRTDTATKKLIDFWNEKVSNAAEIVPVEFARQLEREIHEVVEVCDLEIRQRMKLEGELTKAINAARFMAAYLEDRGERSGRAYALCREVGWPS